MKNISIILPVLMVFLILTLFACNKDKDEFFNFEEYKTYAINFIPAKTNSELTELKKDKNNNLIRNLDQLDALILNGYTPLVKISKKNINEFKEGLVFRDDVGLVGIKYGSIENILTEKELYEVLTIFGLDIENGYWHGISPNSRKTNVQEDYKGYWCRSKGWCDSNVDSICLDGC